MPSEMENSKERLPSTSPSSSDGLSSRLCDHCGRPMYKWGVGLKAFPGNAYHLRCSFEVDVIRLAALRGIQREEALAKAKNKIDAAVRKTRRFLRKKEDLDEDEVPD